MTHPHTVTVPGAAAGWCDTLDKFGTMTIDTVLAPAIKMAEEGFPVHPMAVRFGPSRNFYLRFIDVYSNVFFFVGVMCACPPPSPSCCCREDTRTGMVISMVMCCVDKRGEASTAPHKPSSTSLQSLRRIFLTSMGGGFLGANMLLLFQAHGWESGSYLLKEPTNKYGGAMLKPDGQAPKAGDIMRMPELAATFREVAASIYCINKYIQKILHIITV